MRFQLNPCGPSTDRSGRRRSRRAPAVGPRARAGRPRRPKRAVEAAPEEQAPKWVVRILDNPWNTYEEVIRICVVALGCDIHAAYQIAWTVDHEGTAVVLEADEATASHVAGIIETIGIEVRVEKLAPESRSP
jgi:ATP-dependent Clp protease adaptor protein ClpS